MIFDYVSIMVLYGVAAYNLCQNLLLNFGILKTSDMLDPKKLIFDEYSSKMMKIRAVFFISILILSIPNLL